MIDNARIASAAKALVDNAPEIFGASAVPEALLADLAPLIVAASGSDEPARRAANRIVETVSKNDVARDWMRTELVGHVEGGGQLRIFEQIPGASGTIHADAYVCPQGDYTWYLPMVGVPVPVCPTHNVALVRQR